MMGDNAALLADSLVEEVSRGKATNKSSAGVADQAMGQRH